ncbi:hypothetical protein BDI4_670067 [Burkholderia diffusa]|nr:hypothetical protein BDI4_670067 [Burkholderia diffusa]
MPRKANAGAGLRRSRAPVSRLRRGETDKNVMFPSGCQRGTRAIMALPDRAARTTAPRPSQIPDGHLRPPRCPRD